MGQHKIRRYREARADYACRRRACTLVARVPRRYRVIDSEALVVSCANSPCFEKQFRRPPCTALTLDGRGTAVSSAIEAHRRNGRRGGARETSARSWIGLG